MRKASVVSAAPISRDAALLVWEYAWPDHDREDPQPSPDSQEVSVQNHTLDAVVKDLDAVHVQVSEDDSAYDVIAKSWAAVGLKETDSPFKCVLQIQGLHDYLTGGRLLEYAHVRQCLRDLQELHVVVVDRSTACNADDKESARVMGSESTWVNKEYKETIGTGDRIDKRTLGFSGGVDLPPEDLFPAMLSSYAPVVICSRARQHASDGRVRHAPPAECERRLRAPHARGVVPVPRLLPHPRLHLPLARVDSRHPSNY